MLNTALSGPDSGLTAKLAQHAGLGGPEHEVGFMLSCPQSVGHFLQGQVLDQIPIHQPLDVTRKHLYQALKNGASSTVTSNSEYPSENTTRRSSDLITLSPQKKTTGGAASDNISHEQAVNLSTPKARVVLPGEDDLVEHETVFAFEKSKLDTSKDGDQAIDKTVEVALKDGVDISTVTK